MVPFAGLVLLVCSMSVAGCGQGREPSPAAAATDSASEVVDYAELPTRLCLYVDRNRLEAIRQGQVRLWLQLRNRSPSTRYSPAFTISTVDADGASAWQEPFAMHVDQIEPTTGEAQPQRFMFRLSEAPIQTNAADEVCFKLDRADAAAAVEHSSGLEIKLRWQEVAPPGEVPS